MVDVALDRVLPRGAAAVEDDVRRDRRDLPYEVVELEKGEADLHVPQEDAVHVRPVEDEASNILAGHETHRLELFQVLADHGDVVAEEPGQVADVELAGVLPAEVDEEPERRLPKERAIGREKVRRVVCCRGHGLTLHDLRRTLRLRVVVGFVNCIQRSLTFIHR